MDPSQDDLIDWEAWTALYGPDWVPEYSHDLNVIGDYQGNWANMGGTAAVNNSNNVGPEEPLWFDTPSTSTARDASMSPSARPSSSSVLVHPSPTQQEPNTTSTPVTTLFPDLSIVQRTEPPYSSSYKLQRGRPRFEGDLYTALWVRGESTERAGWCGFCSSWRRLKNSTYVSCRSPPNPRHIG